VTARRRAPKKASGTGYAPDRRSVIVACGIGCAVLAAAGFLGGRWSGRAPGSSPYAAIIEQWCVAYNVDPNMAAAVLEAESSGRPRAVSSAGALGLMQLMPPTADELAREIGLGPPSKDDLFDPSLNIRLGVYYLSKLRRRFGDERELVIAAYHAGPTRVDAWRKSRADLAAPDIVDEIAFPQTRKYVTRVLSLWKAKASASRLTPAAE
jgi:soluble lytic murein transglycosylase